MNFLNKINQFLTNLSVSKFIIVITLSMFLCSTILGVLTGIFNINPSDVQPSITQAPTFIELLFAVILAPLIETLIFPYAVIKILKKIKFFRNNNLMTILISSLLFGIQHFYSLSYIINTTFLGIFLAYAFVVYEKKKESSYWVVCIIHSLKNFISFILLNISLIYHIF